MTKKLITTFKNPAGTLSRKDAKPILKGRRWLEEWYSNPVTQQVYNSNVSEGDKIQTWNNENKDLLNRRDKLKKTIFDSNMVNVNGYMDEYLNTANAELANINDKINSSRRQYIENSTSSRKLNQTNSQLDSSIKSMKNSPYGYYDTQQFAFPNGKSSYSDEIIQHHNNQYKERPGLVGIQYGRMTTYRDKDWADTAIGHEDMHRMQLLHSENTADRILDEHGYNHEDNSTYSGYLDSGQEVLSRMTTVRIKNGLKPEDRSWTPERVDELKKNNKGDDRFLDRYDSATIADLFNLVAKADVKNNNNSTYAKRGKKLIPRKK